MSKIFITDGSTVAKKAVQKFLEIPDNKFDQNEIFNNVFSLTKYRGLDPEVSVGNGVLYQGVDAGMLPQSRSFNFGVTINL